MANPATAAPLTTAAKTLGTGARVKKALATNTKQGAPIVHAPVRLPGTRSMMSSSRCECGDYRSACPPSDVGHYRSRLGSHPIAQVFYQMAPASGGDPDS